MWTSGAVWSALILVCCYFDLRTSSYTVNSILNPIILEFFMGCVAASLFCKMQLHPDQGRKLMVFGVLSLSMTILIANELQILPPETNAQDMTRILLFGLPSFIIVLGAAYWNNQSFSLLARIGDSSYSLYLIHGTVISTIMIILERSHLINLTFKNEVISVVTSIILFATTIIAGYVFYILIEKPSCRIGRKMISNRFLSK